MENKSISKKVLFSGSLVASAILGLTALQTNANPVSYTNLGSGAAVRSVLTGTASAVNTVELACSKDSSTAKSKEHKCAQGKCAEGKCVGDPKKAKGKKGDKHKSDTTKSGS
ncbi:hypothetical protein SAMN04488128_105430 [Chitinophaga eiseniae]|uniref:Low-complexity protein n=1 Tax=Chitinophaga eiseniae TaxID=634771 RepID=A0A1T4TLQ0_9BACT|nr:hypothetical protein [Chitinophaga eiseniae]SKA41390.1 hypothetical protein SAMN04488128_105430 [Chitinophaga eiseniae]